MTTRLALLLVLPLLGCQSTTSAFDGLAGPEIARPTSANTGDPSQYPNFNILPETAHSQMSAEEEAALLVDVIAALEAQPKRSPQDQALYQQKLKRLQEIRTGHAKQTEAAIEAR